MHEGVEGRLEDVRVVYLRPLKALSNDIQRNLEQPLAGIGAQLTRLGMPAFEIRAQVRTGDTSQTERAAMRRLAPHILVTTPESLYLLLTSESGRRMLSTARTVIVDEIHAVAGTKRGAHLALSLERLDALAPKPMQRIGLSATQKPIEEIARFLTGAQPGVACEIVDSGHVRKRDLGLVMPGAPLEAVMSGEVWSTVYDQLASLVSQHHTTLFANTRRMVERVTRHLAERVGEENVAAHHGSLAKEQLRRRAASQGGRLKAMVATASLELGIDIGDVGSSVSSDRRARSRCFCSASAAPITRSAACRRAGCSRRAATSWWNRWRCSTRCVARSSIGAPASAHPLDVLHQQIVAEVAAREYGEDELFSLVTRAWPYRELRARTLMTCRWISPRASASARATRRLSAP